MKRVVFKQNKNLNDRIKNISVLTKSEDKDSKTQVHKSFVYKVSIARENEVAQSTPQVFIKKSIDTRNGIEKFRFKVNGAFYMDHEDQKVKVSFTHSLNISVKWKKKIFSPKKSEKLTKWV